MATFIDLHRTRTIPAREKAVNLRWFAVPAALWFIAATLSIGHPAGLRFEQYAFLFQDAPIGSVMITWLMLMSWRAGSVGDATGLSRWMIATAVALCGLAAWAGHYWLMSGYPLSRDENLARMAASYLAQGRLGLATPPEWRSFHDALSPVLLNPMGGNHYWISVYLPGSAAIEALVSRVADPATTQPLLLTVGLGALWHVSGILLPGRTDARAVAMLLALTSAQLLFNAMTAYAMTAHFALNMLWLALFLRNRAAGHVGALAIGALALALHKVQFHVLFAGPVLATLIWQRRWLLSALYAGCYGVFLLFWIKLYPLVLIHSLDLSAAVGTASGTSLSPRLGTLNPLLYVARFFAWNNALLLPLAVGGAIAAVKAWRGTDTPPRSLIFLGLSAGCGLGLLLSVHQGLGWGYRYLHGYIGAFCLLAGFGWTWLFPRPAGLRPVLMTSALTLLLMVAQAMMIHDFVSPYARIYAEARSRKADVVLIDTRGSAFGQDIVRIDGASVRKPVLMDMARLDRNKILTLCRRYTVQIVDRSDYRRAGVMEDDTRPDAPYVARMRAYGERIGCIGHVSATGTGGSGAL